MVNVNVRVMVKCPTCDWRILDKVTPTTGVIEMKCPRCGKIVMVDLSLRRNVKFRLAKKVG